LALILLLTQSVVLADQPTLYGQFYVRLDDSENSSQSNPEPGAGPYLAVADESLFRAQLQQREQREGPYSDMLAEPLAGLGHYYRDKGEYEEALGLFQRAVHVTRVNDGLYSERQIPYVRDLLDTFRLAGDMQALDERYEYYFRLYGGGQPPYDDLRLRAALEYLRWQREAVGRLDDHRVQRMLDLYELNEEILLAVADSEEISLDWYRQLLMSQVHNLYLVQSGFQPQQQYAGTVGPGNAMYVSQNQGMDLHQQRLESILRVSPKRGQLLLEELLARTLASGDDVELARVHLALGDWQRWNGRSRSAGEQYREVIKLLEDAGEDTLLQQWLGSPVELPQQWRLRRFGSDKRIELTADYAVSAQGVAKDIRVATVDSGSEALSKRLRRKLSATRFRPRYIHGEAEAAGGISRKYALFID
jgi:tetratricopeptide (TPR) repeat protein